MDYDRAYRETSDYFGEEADPLLARTWELIGRDGPVLDLGCGQGRHALFLARHGVPVHAVDPSGVATSRLAEIAGREGLPIVVRTGAFADIDDLVPDDGYAAVLVFGLVQLLDRTEIEELAGRIESWLRPGAMVQITAFSTEDPAYPRISSQWQRVGPHCYRSPSGEVATYLEPDEVPRLLPSLAVVHHWHGLGPWHRHGDSESERHGRIEAILRKPGR